MCTFKCLAGGIGGVMINPKSGAIWSSWISKLRKWWCSSGFNGCEQADFFLRDTPWLFEKHTSFVLDLWKIKEDGITFLLFKQFLGYIYSTKFVFFYFLGRFCFNNHGFRHHLRKQIKS